MPRKTRSAPRGHGVAPKLVSLAALVSLGGAACRARETSTRADAAAADSADARLGTIEVQHAHPDAGAAGRPASEADAAARSMAATAPADEGVAMTTPRIIAFEGGALLVGAVNDEASRKSTLVAQPLDARGARLGPPRTLHTTNGAVDDIAVARAGDRLWIGWTSVVPGAASAASTRIVAVVPVDFKASRAGAPVTLKIFAEDPGAAPGAEIEIEPRTDASGAILVAFSSDPAEAVCMGRPPEETRCTGRGYEVVAVSARGEITRLIHRGLDGGPAVALTSPLDLGFAVVAGGSVFNGGLVGDDVIVGADGGLLATPSLPRCGYTLSRAWTGAELVTMCWSDYTSAKDPCPAGQGLQCDRLYRQTLRADGDSGPAAVASHLLRTDRACAEGHPVLRYVTDRGTVTVDAWAPGASGSGLRSVWTGERLLSVSNPQDTASTVRVSTARCTKAGTLVDETDGGS